MRLLPTAWPTARRFASHRHCQHFILTKILERVKKAFIQGRIRLKSTRLSVGEQIGQTPDGPHKVNFQRLPIFEIERQGDAIDALVVDFITELFLLAEG